MKIRKSNQKGFTIIELMISTLVFSVVLLICAIAIVQVGRMFYKAMISSRTQDVTRKIVTDIAQAVQYGGTDPVVGVTDYGGGVFINYVCVGGTRYSFTTQHSLGPDAGQRPHVLWRDRFSGTCRALDTRSADPGNGGQELLSRDMRVPKFIVEPQGDFVKVDIVISYGATTDLFANASMDSCISSDVGGQFCAVSKLTTYLKKRI